MAPFSMINFIIDQWSQVPLTPAKDLSGKTIVVVGANTGLGREAARHLAGMNPGKLILACRSVERGEAALKDIHQTTGCKTLEVWQLDLAEFASIKSFADRFEQEGGGRLDVLLENAGIGNGEFTQTKDGWETALQVNHLGTVLLAILLLPVLSKTPFEDPFPRIAVVSSGAHFMVDKLREGENGNILDTLNDKSHCTPDVMGKRYHVTKLFNIWFTRALAARLPVDTPVTIDVLNPGFCNTELSRNVKESLMGRLMRTLLARSAEAGSRTLLHAAIGGTQKEMQGRYLDRCRVVEESDYAISEEGQKLEDRVWNETIEILRKVDPRVENIVDKYLKVSS